MDVLLVEDDPCNQLLMSDSLELLGFCPTTCDNGQDALDELGRRRYELVFLDLELPVLDGLSTVRAIRSQLHYQPRIIVSSARELDEVLRLCHGLGVDACLSKPPSLSELERVIRECCPEATIVTPDAPATCLDDVANALTLSECLDPRQVEELLSLAEPGDELLVEIVDMFLERGDALIEELRQAHLAQDRTRWTAAAHELRGCSLAVGAHLVARASQSLEERVTAWPGTEDVEREFAQARQAVQIFLVGGANA